VAASASKVKASLAVALLGRADNAREILRHALQDLGADVVFEGDPASLQSEEILRKRPQVVIVNLASGVEDDIDHLQPLFDSDAVNVVFNEADVSSQLAGWDLARWARHLAAKVMGHERTIPPPPPGAELLPMRNLMPVPGAPPTPASLARDRPIEEFMIEAEDLVDAVPSNHLPLARARPSSGSVAPEPAPDFGIDLERVEDALAQTGMAPVVEPVAEPAPVAPPVVAAAAPRSDFDFDALDAAFGLAPAKPRPSAPAPAAATPAAVSPAPPRSTTPAEPEPEPELAPAPLVVELLRESPAGDDTLALDTSDLLDLSALEDALEVASSPAAARQTKTDAELLDDALSGLDLSLIDDAEEPTSAADSASFEQSASDGLDYEPSSRNRGSVDEYDFAGFESDAAPAHESTGIESIELSSGDIELDSDGSMDADVAALAAQLDALDSSTPRQDAVVDLTFIDFSDAPDAAPVAAPKIPAAPTPAARAAVPAATRADTGSVAAKLDFGSLALTPMDDETPVDAPAPSAPAASKYDFSGLGDLSLEPTEEELEARSARPAERVERPAASSLDSLLAAMDLAPPSTSMASSAHVATDTIQRVIVLGASIGGPDALRTFLGGIPESFPALFVLVQHLENGFFERLAQQLQKASKLPVRVPDGVARARTGEVLVVSAAQRVSIEPDGQITLSPHVDTPRYSPCIDLVMRDVADRFGANATAIIFSGMAGDAIEGAVYLTTLGGEVWAQDPASCVVSSMVDGASARGVVEFLGSPRELAEHCVARYGAA
jgi:chemotaxis response regulator CheB